MKRRGMSAWSLLEAITCVIISLSTTHAADYGRRCPSNVTAEAGTGWTPCGFPNVLTNQRGCGRPRNITWNYRLCNPNYMISYEAAWSVEEYIRDAEVTTPYVCNDIRDAATNFTFGFALLDNVGVPDLSSPYLCTDTCGRILPHVSGREPTQEEVTLAMEKLATAVQAQWKLGVCQNDVISIYSRKHQILHTVVGSRAQGALSAGRLASINAGAVDYYFRRGQIKEGVTYTIGAYKQALLGYSPAYIVMTISGGLLILLLCITYFVLNVGRETTVLYDESLPTTALKAAMYVLSLLWLVKWALLYLGWVQEEPKKRSLYLLVPTVACLLCVLVAWLSSPSVRGYK